MLAEIADAVRSGKVDPVDLVDEALRRIEAANPTLNAVVALRAEEARAEARSHDRQGTLAGVPILVKDLENLAGMPTSYGSLLHAEDPPAQRTDTVPARLLEAGAIVVGKTNTPEFGWTAVTSNRVYGATRNPWNTDCSPGGSSGGSGAAVAAGLVPIATATDGGGSVRIPAAMCGLVGYKPSFGAIGRTAIPKWITFSTAGAIATSVADMVAIADVVSGSVDGDINTLPSGSVPLSGPLPSRAIAVPTLRERAAAPVEQAFRRVCGVLADDVGLAVDEGTSPILLTDPDIATAWLFLASTELAQSLEWAEGRDDELDPGMLVLVTLGRHVSLSQYLAAQRGRYEAAAQLDAALGEDTVLVTPTVNPTSWPAEGPMPTEIDGVPISPLSAVNTMDFNFTGHPAVAVPMGVSPEGVPMSLQVVAPRFRDDLAISVAAAIEQAMPWPTTAPGYDPFPASL